MQLAGEVGTGRGGGMVSWLSGEEGGGGMDDEVGCGGDVGDEDESGGDERGSWQRKEGQDWLFPSSFSYFYFRKQHQVTDAEKRG
jgi:hypothetical protein